MVGMDKKNKDRNLPTQNPEEPFLACFDENRERQDPNPNEAEETDD
jgi:hypothetical protein